MKKKLQNLYLLLIVIFLYAPIMTLMVLSFNSSRTRAKWGGFTGKWYVSLFQDEAIMSTLYNTLIIALLSALIATVIGTLASIGIQSMNRKFRTFMLGVTNIPMLNADIVTGVSMMLLFIAFRMTMGFSTILIAHITFNIPYVILSVMPKLKQTDKSTYVILSVMPKLKQTNRRTYEAALDLGASPIYAFFKVVFPDILPGILSGFLLAFTMSLDDFVITHFTKGPGIDTLSTKIYSEVRKGIRPEIYALSTIMFVTVLFLLFLINLKPEKEVHEKDGTIRKPSRARHTMHLVVTRVVPALLVIVITAGGFFYNSKTKISGSEKVIVYNWGEYISDGSDDSLDTIAAFEDWYKATYGVPVKVNYDTYASNEDMYAKLKSGAVSYDVVIPSDYMIARMEAEDMLLPLNYDNIPNYQYISEDFRGLYYDPDDTYTVPYTYGIVGVIYNANVVDEADTGNWDLMWNPKYAGNILQYNNARDALGTAMYRAGIDVNTTDHAAWERALQALVNQRPLVKSYVMDEIYNMMESGEAAVASYYAGDYFTMCDAQADSVDLQFYYPDETNYFIDAMCIPSCCRDQELAECFINFMLSREAAVANAEYIYYASPNRLVYDDPEYIDDMGEDTMAILYPDIGSFRDAYNRSAYRNLDQDTLTYVNSLWETLKIN